MTELGIRRINLCSCSVFVSRSNSLSLFLHLCNGNSTEQGWQQNDMRQEKVLCRLSGISPLYDSFNIFFVWVNQSGSNSDIFFRAYIKHLLWPVAGYVQTGQYDQQWRHHKNVKIIPKKISVIHEKTIMELRTTRTPGKAPLAGIVK